MPSIFYFNVNAIFIVTKRRKTKQTKDCHKRNPRNFGHAFLECFLLQLFNLIPMKLSHLTVPNHPLDDGKIEQSN